MLFAHESTHFVSIPVVYYLIAFGFAIVLR